MQPIMATHIVNIYVTCPNIWKTPEFIHISQKLLYKVNPV
uniref:Uncharacterized protein n=1 Tax=Arundo donax TaxID=35708 RepID=A0A0A9DW61_ARUDO